MFDDYANKLTDANRQLCFQSVLSSTAQFDNARVLTFATKLYESELLIISQTSQLFGKQIETIFTQESLTSLF